MPTENESPNPQEVLSQSEVERVLAEMNSVAEKPPETAKPFRQSSILPESEFRRVRTRYEQFVEALSGRLSTHLRMDVSVSMTRLGTGTFQEFIAGTATPSHMTLFKIEPQRGVCLLEITPRLALTFVDRLLGGPGHSVEAKDSLSEIEVILFDQMTKILLSEWCAQWSDLQELRPVLLGHEIDARYLNTLPRTEVMFVVTLEMAIGDCREPARLGFPYFTLEPLLAKLAAESKATVSQVPVASAPKWNQIFANVQVPVTAVFDALDLTARQLTALKVGDTLPLEPSRFAQIRVRLGETAKFVATAGTSGQLWAVQLTGEL